MKFIASLLAAATLSAATLAAHAAPVNPLSDGYSISIGNTVLTNSNLLLNLTNGNFVFTDLTNTYTFAEVDASPLVSGLSITRACAAVGGVCGSSVVSVSNANVLNGLLQASVMVNASVQATASANVSNVVFAATNANIGLESAIVGYSAPSSGTSPVPEPGTLGLMATGLVGAAGAVRRRFRA